MVIQKALDLFIKSIVSSIAPCRCNLFHSFPNDVSQYWERKFLMSIGLQISLKLPVFWVKERSSSWKEEMFSGKHFSHVIRWPSTYYLPMIILPRIKFLKNISFTFARLLMVVSENLDKRRLITIQTKRRLFKI